MADRYQDRPFPADEYDRGGQQGSSPKSDADPLAELARLIGQNDPFSNFGRGNATVPPRASAPAPYRPAAETPARADEDIELGPPPAWMQSRAPDIAPRQEPLSARHPLRPAAPMADPYDHQSYQDAQPYASNEAPLQADPGRYDDALYGQIEPVHGMADASHAGVYPEPPYGYEDGYAEETEPKPRRTGMVTIAAVLALAVVGTGGAFAYRTYMGAPRSGEAPVIRADPGPTKVLPPDGAGKPIQDRLAAANGAEALVSREEQPVDPGKASPRVVLPPLAQNPNPPFPAAPQTKLANQPAPAAGDEPRKIRTLSVRPDQADAAAAPVGRPAPGRPAAPAATATATPRNPPAPVANANASAPLSLSPQAQTAAPEPRTRVANAPASPQSSGAGASGSYVVQVSSQRSESDAQSSYRTLQSKFPSVLGSRSALIKRADLGDKGVYYRAMVGPFGSPDEASAFCGNLKSAGGQCVVQRN